jgi:serine/threonine-protein kinase
MAFDRFRRVPAGDSVRENLYQLALDFERKRQFNKALAVYDYIAAQDPGFKDVKLKRVQAQRLSNSIVMGRDEKLIAAAVFENETIEKPTLGRYNLDAELGKGAMGVVYRGLDPKIGRVVALKTMALAEEFSGDELVDARARFFREAETAGRLQHPNIVTIFDAGEESDLAYIAMEFVGGTDLVKHTKPENLLPVDTVLSIVSRVSLALDYAHRQQVVHRDIKPANIMFEPDTNAVKVTDFGIARISDSYKTKTGLVLGTPSFMSPEQLAGASADGRSDLYSLGVTLYQLLTGVLPFRGDSMAELMYKITHEEAVDVRLHRPDLTEELARLVQRAVMKAPEARFQTGAEFALCLEKYATNHGNIPPVGVQAVTVDITMQNTIPLKQPARPAPDIEI